MAIKERNDSPCKAIGEGFFSALFFSIPLFMEAAQHRELCFGTLAGTLVRCMLESQY